MASKKDSVGRTLFVAVAVCFVCAVVVSVAAVQLRPAQQFNQQIDKQSNILAVAGFDVAGLTSREVADLYDERIDTRIVDLRTGEYTDQVDPASYDQRAASQNPDMSKNLSGKEDVASIKRRAHYAPVYIVRDDAGEDIRHYILPVHGYGLWSTLYGFIALEPDADTVYGLSFYDHAETPGLGGEVDNPKWKAQWQGKELFNEQGELAIQVVKSGQVKEEKKEHQVDGLAGASLTTYGVNNLVRYWMSEAGFGPFLDRLKKS
ncbi:MAG: Na(+)-translocating NADH-quinone reductase subunit C [Pseudomonadota bacterium]